MLLSPPALGRDLCAWAEAEQTHYKRVSLEKGRRARLLPDMSPGKDFPKGLSMPPHACLFRWKEPGRRAGGRKHRVWLCWLWQTCLPCPNGRRRTLLLPFAQAEGDFRRLSMPVWRTGQGAGALCACQRGRRATGGGPTIQEKMPSTLAHRRL